METRAAHGVRMAGSEAVGHGCYPLALEEASSQNGNEANVNKHVFIEQKYVQYPICSALDCAYMERGGKGREEKLAECRVAKAQ